MNEWRAVCPIMTIANAITCQGVSVDPRAVCADNCAFYNRSQKICVISGQQTILPEPPKEAQE